MVQVFFDSGGREGIRTHNLLIANEEKSILVIRRIHVAMRLVASENTKEIVERTHGIYAMRCPLYRTLHNAIQLTSSVEIATSNTKTGGKS